MVHRMTLQYHNRNYFQCILPKRGQNSTRKPIAKHIRYRSYFGLFLIAFFQTFEAPHGVKGVWNLYRYAAFSDVFGDRDYQGVKVIFFKISFLVGGI